MFILPQSVDPQTKILTLMAHAAMGRRLLPTVWIAGDGRCSCMEREAKTDTRICSRSKPGKHPRISQWQVKASCEPEQILEWHGWLPLANWGWLQTDTFTLDVDPKRGGLESLAQWEEEVGGPAHTLIQTTPSGGRHLIYAQPSGENDQRITVQGDVLPGIEIRGIGSYIMVDPSIGPGGRWVLQNPNTPPTEPDELTLRLIARHGIDTSLGEPGGDGVEVLGLGRAKKSSRGRGKSDLPPVEWFQRNGLGDYTGSRNVDAYRLAWRLLYLGDRFPDVYTTTYIAYVMRSCWEQTAQGDSGFPWDECLGALRSAWKRREKQKREDYAAQLKMATSLLSQPQVGGQ